VFLGKRNAKHVGVRKNGDFIRHRGLYFLVHGLQAIVLKGMAFHPERRRFAAPLESRHLPLSNRHHESARFGTNHKQEEEA
jgi:hypothetical protein